MDDYYNNNATTGSLLCRSYLGMEEGTRERGSFILCIFFTAAVAFSLRSVTMNIATTFGIGLTFFVRTVFLRNHPGFWVKSSELGFFSVAPEVGSWFDVSFFLVGMIAMATLVTAGSSIAQRVARKEFLLLKKIAYEKVESKLDAVRSVRSCFSLLLLSVLEPQLFRFFILLSYRY